MHDAFRELATTSREAVKIGTLESLVDRKVLARSISSPLRVATVSEERMIKRAGFENEK